MAVVLITQIICYVTFLHSLSTKSILRFFQSCMFASSYVASYDSLEVLGKYFFHRFVIYKVLHPLRSLNLSIRARNFYRSFHCVQMKFN